MGRITAILLLTAFFISCGGGGSDASLSLQQKKDELAKLMNDQATINARIAELEKAIAKEDPSAPKEKAKLVSVAILQRRDFKHYIDLQGKLATDEMYYVSPRGMGGQVKAVYVKAGDFVKKGQLLLKLDDALVQESLRQVEIQLAFARDIYNRQKNLWSEGIGTEVQFLSARNNVESLEKQLALVKEQASMSSVYAQVSGIAETVNIRVGEMFTGSPLAGITIVNPASLKAVVDVPENYVSKVKRGMKVSIEVPDLGKRIDAQISLVSETINVNSRSFVAECRISPGQGLKPNQLAVIHILDHAADNAMVVPVETVQSDEKGKYVFVMKEEQGKKIARKVTVTIGRFYDEQIEVITGLNDGENLIVKGFQGLYDGQTVDLAKL